MSFPIDDYTPFGYLANPAAATSWQDHRGGSLRTAGDVVGFGWAYPWDRRATAVVELALRLTVGGRAYATRDEWAALGLHAAYHSANLFSFDWSAAAVTGAWRLCLADAHTLVGAVELRNEAPFPRTQRLALLARVTGAASERVTVEPASDGWRLRAGTAAPVHALRLLDDGGLAVARADGGPCPRPAAVGEAEVLEPVLEGHARPLPRPAPRAPPAPGASSSATPRLPPRARPSAASL